MLSERTRVPVEVATPLFFSSTPEGVEAWSERGEGIFTG